MHRLASLTGNAAEVTNALKARGHLKLRCEPVVTDAINQVFHQADKFFSLPLAIKHRNALNELCEGYRGLGTEYSDVEERPDLHESFWLHVFNVEKAQAHFDNHGNSLYKATLHVAHLFDDMIASMVVAFQRHYGTPNPDEPHFSTLFGSHLQLNYYVPVKHERDLLMDCHEDGLLFTILHANAPGLEMRLADGSFAPVDTHPGEVFIMAGDITMLMSGGDIRPLYHRVRNRPDVRKRISLMYFANPNASHTSQMMPWRTTDVNRGVDIMQRVIENPLKFGLPPIPIVT